MTIVIPGQLLPNTFKSDHLSTREVCGQIYSNYYGELKVKDGFYFINTTTNLFIVKKRRKDAIFINNEWIKSTDFRIGDCVYYDGKTLNKMEFNA